MNINNAFPSKYLKASDLEGRTPTVKIERVMSEAVGQTRDMLPVIYFEGKEKGMVCNKTNGKMIASIAGTPETDEWPGTIVQLCVVQTEFQGEPVDALRARKPPTTRGVTTRSTTKPVPVPEPPVATTDLTDDDIPF